MSDVVAVILVPSKGDPGRLLATGACGAIPPLVRRWDTGRGPWWGRHYCPEGSVATDDYGLPLWWDGRLVPEGWDRFVRALLPSDGRDDRPVSRFPYLGEVFRATGAAMPNIVEREIRLALDVGGRLVEVADAG